MFPKSLKLTTISLREAMRQTLVVVASCAVCGILVAGADVVAGALVSLVVG